TLRILTSGARRESVLVVEPLLNVAQQVGNPKAVGPFLADGMEPQIRIVTVPSNQIEVGVEATHEVVLDRDGSRVEGGGSASSCGVFCLSTSRQPIAETILDAAFRFFHAGASQAVSRRPLTVQWRVAGFE